MDNRLLLGIDKGTSVTKAVVFDAEGKELAAAQAPIHVVSRFAGWQEEDPAEAWDTLKLAIKQVLAKVDASRIVSISATGYMGGTWMIGNDGHESRNGTIWTDQRAVGMVDRWVEDGTAARFFDISGNAIVAGLTLVVLAWLKQHEPATLARTRHIFGAKDWVRYKLTGIAGTDETEIMWMPGDPRTRTYSDELFALLGITEYRHLFPDPQPSDSIAGMLLPDVARELGLRPDTPVVVGMGDACSGHYATGTLDEGQACTILGTSLINDLTTAEPVFEPVGLGVQFVLIGNKWIRMLPNTGGGSINLRWFLDTLCEPYSQKAQAAGMSVYDLLDEEVSRTPVGSNGVLYHPYINRSGVIAPFFNLDASANFFGLRTNSTHADMLRAVYEGVGLAVYDCFAAIPRPVESLRLTGGGARSAVWCQIVADCMNTICEVPGGEETTAKGVAMLAGVAVGLYADYRDAVNKTVQVERVYTPIPENVVKYKRLYPLFRKIREDLEASWHLRAATYAALDK
ncbi:MAG: FGGY-family carbohydrate kinase [Chloroflexota bacterium]